MTVPSIAEIKANILAEKTSYENLNGLNSTSKVATYNLWAYIVAAVIWVQYQFIALFQTEIDQKIREQKRYTLLDFRRYALAYRHGHPLNDLTGEYDDAGYTEEEIEEALIVARAAVIELELNNRKHLFIKVAKEVNNVLQALNEAEQEGVTQYFARIKPAGTKIIIFSGAPDDLRMTLDFYYDPLILDETGARIDGATNTPVQDAIRAYIKDLKFNGEFSIAILEDRLQELSGCADREAYVRSCEANYQTPENYQEITTNYVANSGYMQILDENLQINFIAKTVAL